MRTLRILAAAVLVLSLLNAPQASAGAWPREPGTWFATAAVRLGWPQNLAHWTSTHPTSQYNTLYVEYGATRRLTLGLDLGRSVSGGTKTVGFLRWPLRRADRGMQASVEFGIGQVSGHQVVRPGLSVGWGFARGWLSLDGLAEVAVARQSVDLKLDITSGWNLPGDRKLILQVQTGDTANDPAFIRLAPSVVVPLNDRLRGELGATWGLKGDTSMGLKFGLWAEF